MVAFIINMQTEASTDVTERNRADTSISKLCKMSTPMGHSC